MRIILEGMRFINWKGAIDESYSYLPGTNIVRGDNGTGKTRQPEGLRWGMTGKDLEDRSDFDIKNNKLTQYNQQDSVVMLHLLADGKKLDLERIYREKHTKKKGSAVKSFDGHETAYKKNGVPKSASEYKDIVSELIPESVFKILTDPLFFNTMNGTKWTWKMQREILISMVGEISDEDILSVSTKKYGRFDKLKTLLAEKADLDEHVKGLKNQIKNLKEELDGIPGRIDEALRGKPNTTEEEFLEAEKALEVLKLRDEAIVAEMTEIQNKGQKVIEAFYLKKNEVSTLRSEAKEIFNSFKAEKIQIFNNKARDKRNLLSDIANIEYSINSDTRARESEISRKEAKRAELRKFKESYDELKNSVFVFDETPYQALNCPTCGKEMKSATLDFSSIKITQENAFNVRKAADLESRKAEGISIKNAIDGYNEPIEAYEKSIEAKKASIEGIRAQISGMEEVKEVSDEEIQALCDADPVYSELILHINNLESILPEQPKPVDNEEKKSIRKEIEALKEVHIKTLATKSGIQSAERRVKELTVREEEVSQLIADAENEVYMVEGYGKSKMEVVEDRVNKMFDNVSFKLFNTLVNGGIEEVCMLWFKDRPWVSLNTADKIWAGLECIKTMNEYYNIYAPIFIDNRESTFRIPEMNTQVISLIATEGVSKIQVN